MWTKVLYSIYIRMIWCSALRSVHNHHHHQWYCAASHPKKSLDRANTALVFFIDMLNCKSFSRVHRGKVFIRGHTGGRPLVTDHHMAMCLLTSVLLERTNSFYLVKSRARRLQGVTQRRHRQREKMLRMFASGSLFCFCFFKSKDLNNKMLNGNLLYPRT